MPSKPVRLGKGMIATVGATMAMFFCMVVGAQGQPQPVELNIVKSAGGTVTSATAPTSGATCGTTEPESDCESTYPSGTEVTLTATPEVGFRFSGWNAGDCVEETTNRVTNSSTCRFTITTAKRIRINFDEVMTLTVRANQGGTVTSTPDGIDCGNQCNADFNRNTSVTLTATPDIGFRTRWGNGCNSINGNTCTVSVDQTKTVNVEFIGVTGWIQIEGDGTILVSGSGRTTSCTKDLLGGRCREDLAEWLRLGSTITLTAIPDPGNSFQGWGGGLCMGTESSCTVKLNPHNVIAIIAIFSDDTSYPLYINKTGNGSGTVTSIPTGISCGRDCQAIYAAGTTVTLTAEIEAGSHFSWGGACSSSNPRGGSTQGNRSICTLTMDQAQSVTAAFTKTPSIIIHKTGQGHVTSAPAGIFCGEACSAEYESGKTVTLTALPDAANGWRFDGWGKFDQCAGYALNQCILSVKAAETINVTFTKDACESRAFSLEEKRMMDMYIAYYGRPPYAEGLRYWVDERMPAVGGNVNAIIDAFGQSEEYDLRFGGMSYAALVGKLYEYILGRTAEPEGLNNYVNLLAAGRETVGSIAIKILDNVASGSPDVAALNNRRVVAQHLAFKTEEGRSYLTAVDLAAIMKDVTADRASADIACKKLSDTISWK